MMQPHQREGASDVSAPKGAVQIASSDRPARPVLSTKGGKGTGREPRASKEPDPDPSGQAAGPNQRRGQPSRLVRHVRPTCGSKHGYPYNPYLRWRMYIQTYIFVHAWATCRCNSLTPCARHYQTRVLQPTLERASQGFRDRRHAPG
jgi:hypothetical protein